MYSEAEGYCLVGWSKALLLSHAWEESVWVVGQT